MAVYYVWSAATGTGNGSSWANAFTTLTTAFVTEAAGDTLYVAHDHAESTATALSLATSSTLANMTKVICVNRAGSVPPVSADRRTTAQVVTTGQNDITITGSGHFDGIIFIAGSGATGFANLILVANNSVFQRFDNCSLRLGITAANPNVLQISGTSSGGGCVEFNNTTASFGNAANNFLIIGLFKWRNTPSALLGTVPTVLFMPNTVRGGLVECIGVDFSAAGSGKTLVGALITARNVSFRFVDCKLNASVSKSDAPQSYGSTEVDFIRSGSSALNYTVFRDRVTGRLDQETTIVRSGGASDGTTPIAWKIVTSSTCHYSGPFECPPIAIWNDVTGSSVTATVEGIWGGGAVPLDGDIWIDVEYLGDAASPQGSFVNDGTPDLLTAAANQTSSTATWGGSTTKFKLNVSFTAQQKGWIFARVKCAKGSTTFYVDPLVTLT